MDCGLGDKLSKNLSERELGGMAHSSDPLTNRREMLYFTIIDLMRLSVFPDTNQTFLEKLRGEFRYAQHDKGGLE